MKIKVLETGSKGNCYILTAESGSQLIVECGIKYEKIVPHCDFLKVDGVIVSHCHSDHSLSKLQMEVMGIDVYSHDNLEGGVPQNIGQEWQILPIPMKHGNTECFSFIINNIKQQKTIYFATDCEMLPKIKDKHYDLMLLECNYDMETVYELVEKHKLINKNYVNHMGLEFLTEWLRNRTHKPKNILLIHGSNSGNLDYEKALKTVEPYGENVQIACPNLELEF